MGENQPSDLAELKAEVTRLRQALWEVLVAVDELACAVEFGREQEVGTRPAVEALDRARDILKPSAVPRPGAQRRKAATSRGEG